MSDKKAAPAPIEILIEKPLDGHKAGDIVTLSPDEFKAEIAKGMHYTHDDKPGAGGPDIVYVTIASNLLAHGRVIGQNKSAKELAAKLKGRVEVVKGAKAKNTVAYREFEAYQIKRKARKN